MTPAQAKLSYARAMAASGETMVLRRAGNADTNVQGRIVPLFAPSDVAGSTQQVGRRAILNADDVVRSGFAIPFKANLDRLVVGGTTMTIKSIDDTTRRVRGELIAYELELSGA